MNPKEGLDYILSHFQEPIFPRSISTRATEGRQLVANNVKEALARFTQDNFLDSRISAYSPNVTINPLAMEQFQGLSSTTPENLVVIIDLDKSTFRSERALSLALKRTLRNIDSTLTAKPTVLWSGNGYHIYLVLDCPINLENIKQFSSLGINQISLKFLRFVESFLSNGKSDKAHNTTVSFKNCMMRIPGSINSKNNCEVKLIQEWNGTRPSINYLLADFCGYVANVKVQELREQQSRRMQQQYYVKAAKNNYRYTLQWIEKLLQIPITDGRKFSIWRILVPYLINYKHLSEEECTAIILNWLAKCGELLRLEFNMIYVTRYAIKHVGTYGPVHPDKLSYENPVLYNLLAESKIF
jgi:hypothetical protein